MFKMSKCDIYCVIILVALLLALPFGVTRLARPSNFMALTAFKEGDQLFSRLGEKTYMIAPNGEPISKGYVEFIQLDIHTWIGRNHDLFYMIRDGNIISDGYQSIIPSPTGYDATLPSFVFKLDKNGKVHSIQARKAPSSTG